MTSAERTEYAEALRRQIIALAERLTEGGYEAYDDLCVHMVLKRKIGPDRDFAMPETEGAVALRSAAEHIRQAVVDAGEDFDYCVEEMSGGINGPHLTITALYDREAVRRRDEEIALRYGR